MLTTKINRKLISYVKSAFIIFIIIINYWSLAVNSLKWLTIQIPFIKEVYKNKKFYVIFFMVFLMPFIYLSFGILLSQITVHNL